MKLPKNSIVTPAPQPHFARWLPIVLLALLAAGKPILYDTIDPDCFWHLRVAEQLLRDGIGPIVDDLSFASVRQPWTPYSWLAELGMKAVWDFGGYRAAVLAQALMVGAFVLFVALAAKQSADGDNPIAIVIATAFAMYFALPYLSFRPVTFVLVLLALCGWLLLRDRRLGEQSRAVWLIVPITVLITNCHFYSVLVPVWIAALLLGAIVERRGVRRYAMLLALTSLSCAATPMLPGMISAMWDYQFADPMLSGGIISEFRPFWTNPVSVALLIGWAVLVVRRRQEIRIGEWFWALGSLVLYIRLGRFAPVFMLIAAPLLARAWPVMSGAVLNRRVVQATMACLICVGVARLAIAFPSSQTRFESWVNRHGPQTPGYPCEAADFVTKHVAPGRIVNEFSWGGFLSWRLGAAYPVLLDGRTQLYPPSFWNEVYLDAPDRRREVLAASGASAAVLPLEKSRFRDVLIDLGWQSVYRDDRAEVLLAPEVPAMNASIRE